MTPHEIHGIRPPAGRSGPQRLLPIAGAVVVVLVMLAHIVGGAVLAHASLGSIPGNLGGALAVGLVAIVTLKLLLLLGCGAAGVVGGKRMLAHTSKAHSGMTTGKTIHGAHRYDLFVALLTLGRAGALRDRTIELARITPGEDVLDAGCGTGEIAMRAKVRTGPTGSVAGIDPAPEMIAMARQKAARAGLEIDYRVAAAEALPFADATFDVAVSSLMMHHLPEDLKPRALAEIGRVLNPGGHLVVVDFQRPSSRLGRLAPVWLLHRSENAEGLLELPALLNAAGFTAIETQDTGIGYLGCVRARLN
jgi:ubiquinone/menaquinone biosynthesis C-methylase UbiE